MISYSFTPLAVIALRNLPGCADIKVEPDDPRTKPTKGYGVSAALPWQEPHVYERDHWPMMLSWCAGRKRLLIAPIIRTTPSGTETDGLAMLHAARRVILEGAKPLNPLGEE